MAHLQDGTADAAGTSRLVVDFARKLKDLHPPSARRSKITLPPSAIYRFPLRTTHTPHLATDPACPRAEADPAPAMVRRKLSAQLPAWVCVLTVRRMLMIGATACYALILFNLIYGIASLSRMKSWHPVQVVNATELQRAMAPPVDSRRVDLPLAAASAAGVAPALRTPEPAVNGTRPTLRRGAATRTAELPLPYAPASP
jgi:hypothetical protein